MAQTLTPKEIAQKWDTDARTVRKFLRSPEGTGKVGQGNRHAIDAKSVAKLHRSFNAWIEAKNAKKAESPETDFDALELAEGSNHEVMPDEA